MEATKIPSAELTSFEGPLWRDDHGAIAKTLRIVAFVCTAPLAFGASAGWQAPFDLVEAMQAIRSVRPMADPRSDRLSFAIAENSNSSRSEPPRLLAWVEPSSNGGGLFVLSILPSNAASGAHPDRISEPARRPVRPQVVWAANRFVVVWEEQDDEGPRIAALSFGPTGQALDTAPRTLLRPSGPVSNVHLTSDGSTAELQWVEPRASGNPAAGWKVASDRIEILGELSACRSAAAARPEVAGANSFREPHVTIPITLVADINRMESGSSGTPLAALGSVVILRAFDELGGELWRSDGTGQGTVRIADLCPGACSSSPTLMAADADVAYLAATDPAFGRELWVTDGTAGGTRRVADICPGPCDGINSFYSTAAIVGDRLYFAAEDDSTGIEPWISDGSAAGTRRIRNLSGWDYSSYPQQFTPLGSHVVFSATEWTGAGIELFVTDGTEIGTALAGDICPGSCSSAPYWLASSGSFLIFSANDGVSGIEPWILTDSAPPAPLVDLCPGSCSSTPTEFTPLAGSMLFAAETSSFGRELWSTTGTAVGTTLLKDVLPGTPGSNPIDFTAQVDRVFFVANGGSSTSQLWKSNGTAIGTKLVKDFSSLSVTSRAQHFGTSGSRLYFGLGTTTSGYELWKSDGNSLSTVPVSEICPGACNGYWGGSLLPTATGVWLLANDGSIGLEPWKSDGTASGTVNVANINRSNGSSDPFPLTSVQGILYFTASDGIVGTELWKTNNTEAGTNLVADLRPGAASPTFGTAVAYGGLLVFTADDAVSGLELWRSNGTTAGTFRLKDIALGATGSSPNGFVEAGGLLYFQATDENGDAELWRTDGSKAGTLRVADLCVGTCSSSPIPIAALGGRLMFSANVPSSGWELWSTDGTTVGTAIIRDLCSGSCSGAGTTGVVMASRLYFFGNNGTSGFELWRTDGTSAGTQMVADIEPGSGSKQLGDLRLLGSRVFFSAKNSASGRDPWSSDGTAAGTLALASIGYAYGFGLQSLTTIGSRIYFATGYGSQDVWASDGTVAGTIHLATLDSDIESVPWGPAFVAAGSRVAFLTAMETTEDTLWATDGTAAGTLIVARPGLDVSWQPRELAAFSAAGVALFRGNDAAAGYELWMTDGIPGRAWRLADIALLDNWSHPQYFVPFGSDMLFSAADTSFGKELRRLSAASLPLPPDADGDGVANDADCQANDASTWAPPDPVANLRAEKAGDSIRFTWDPSLSPGASWVRYSIHASGLPTQFSVYSCVAENLTQTDVTIAVPWWDPLYFVVRIENPCPASTAGSASDGTPRFVPECW